MIGINHTFPIKGQHKILGVLIAGDHNPKILAIGGQIQIPKWVPQTNNPGLDIIPRPKAIGHNHLINQLLPHMLLPNWGFDGLV